MDLLSKSVITVVIAVLIIFVAYYTISHVTFAQPVTEQQASSLVLHDLENANPGAAINITNVTPSQYAGSWHILASIVTNATSPCPSYSIYSFDYPKYGFVYQVENKYTSNCVIYGIVAGKGYIIGSYPVAITASYNLNLSSVNNFIQKYGLTKIAVYATYYNKTTLSGKNYTGIWLVNYTAPNARYVAVVLSQVNGTELSAYGSG